MGAPTTLMVVLLAAAQPEPLPARIAEREVESFALTISGGVSLGAYEAGFNWSLVRFLKIADQLGMVGAFPIRPRLVALSGASAGSINALLAAAVWCERTDNPQDFSVDRNLLRDTWLPIGLDQLLPDDPARYYKDDALLSRVALTSVLEDIRRKIFDRSVDHAFTPGCQLPIGFTVTRVAPRERGVGELTAPTQKFVIPLIFEVSPAGWVRLRHQSLLPDRDSAESVLRLAESPLADSGETSVSGEQAVQAILASSAFPVAFSPPELCSCEATCPEERIVSTGTCAGPDPAHPLTGLTCAGLASGGQNLKLCRWDYVDGGIFDNAPLGLAIDEVESWQSPALLHPVLYLFMDPDLRRFQSSISQAPPANPSTQGFAGYLQLLSNLVSTSRNADLARVIKAKNWNRTTGSLLRELALTLSQFVFVYDQLQRLADAQKIDPDEVMPTSFARIADRARVGHLLYDCLEKLRDVRQTRRSLDLLSRCADEAQRLKAGGQSRLVSGGPSDAPAPLTDAEVTTLAEWLEQFIVARANPTQMLGPVAPMRLGPAQESARPEQFRNGIRLSAVAFQFLAEGARNVAHSNLPEEKIRGFRDGLLQAMELGEQLSINTNRLAQEVLFEYLGRLRQQGSGDVSKAAATAIASGEALPDGEIFDEKLLEPLLGTLWAAAASAARQGAELEEQRQLARWLRQGEDLQRVRPWLQQLTSKISALVQSATDLQHQTGGERQLLSSTRFAPLAGSRLYNFAAFLDRPLREFDYYAGVYDGVHQLAVGACLNEAHYFEVPQPRWRPDNPNELDLESPETQRCIGGMMRWISDLLRLQDSKKARQIFWSLASAELSVALGDQAAADSLFKEPVWAWLRDNSLVVEGDSLQALVGALLSPRELCTADAKQSLCVAELRFDEFIAALKARGYRPEEANMRLAMSDPDRWLNTVLQKGADRSAAIELGRSDPPSSLGETVLLGLGAVELWTRRELARSNPPRLVVDPSSLPSEPPANAPGWVAVAAHLFPYRVALDVTRGGVALGWLEPELLLTRGLSIVSLVEPLDYERQRARFSSTLGLLPTAHFGGISLGAGPRYSLHWPLSEGGDLGLQAQVSVLQDRFSFGMGVRQLSGSSFAREWFLLLSVSDLNGTIYWLGPWSSGHK